MRNRLRLLLLVVLVAVPHRMWAEEASIRFRVTIDRGRDLGQDFGSLFEATCGDGSHVLGAGFAGGYNTRYRADRHQIQFFVRPVTPDRSHSTEPLPRPNQLCGTYLYGRDGTVYSTYGGLRAWKSDASEWAERPLIGGNNETMRIADKVLAFGDSRVLCNGTEILGPPDQGHYQCFYYSQGRLCFYHVYRPSGKYGPYQKDADGFSKLYACPWTPDQPVIDLSKASVLTLPIVGETTFAWGQLND